ncbi:hypothetical protein JQ625_29455 [Bradyrhizobium diazoefficiens]|nr:hypothetical protein [Bradyrhizobium diazoefficiens]MBR0778972.1 hypothetical protein [Bradyrhizobium diazoefficiens]
MARYYFDLLDGGAVAVDEEGMELPSLAAAQAEAAQGLADMMRDAAREFAGDGPVLQWAMEVRDDNGPVAQLRYTFEIDRLK